MASTASLGSSKIVRMFWGSLAALLLIAIAIVGRYAFQSADAVSDAFGDERPVLSEVSEAEFTELC